MQLPEAHREAPEKLSGEQLEQLSEKYRAMGLHVIWIKSHDDIPDILDMIRVPVVDDPFARAEAAHRIESRPRRTSQWLVHYRPRPQSILHLASVYIACR